MNKLNPKMSFGHNGFSTKILKESIHTKLLPIIHIINKSLKASDPSKLEHYSLVSLLPAFSKILEKVMYNKLMSYLK